MLSYLIGSVTELSESAIVLEVNQIGYEIFMPFHELKNLPSSKENVKVYVYENRKEDALDLYGFLSKGPKEIFQKLLTVSGIGPKGALQMLHLYTTTEIIQFISTQDVKALSKVSGIGPKTAQRVILELKDSISKYQTSMDELLDTFTNRNPEAKDEAAEALIALGYASTEATKAVQAVFVTGDTTETLIKKALSLLSS